MSTFKAAAVLVVLFFLNPGAVIAGKSDVSKVSKTNSCSDSLLISPADLFKNFFPKDQLDKADDWPWVESERLILYKHKKDILVWSKKDKVVVGMLQYFEGPKSFMITLDEFDPRFLGQGFAFEAEYFALQKGFKNSKLKSAPALIDVKNKASIALHQKLGFERDYKNGLTWTLTRRNFNRLTKKLKKGVLSFHSKKLNKTRKSAGVFVNTLGYNFDPYELSRSALDFAADFDSFLPGFLEHSTSVTVRIFFERLSRESCYMQEHYIFKYSNKCMTQILSQLLLIEPYFKDLSQHDSDFVKRAKKLLASIRQNKYENVSVKFFNHPYSEQGYEEISKKDLEFLEDLELKPH